jgi:1-acyl-sn-glycerol-3-phosphate acyltransferase
MIRTIFFFIILWLSLLISLIFLIPLLFFLLTGSSKIKKKYIRIITSNWSRYVLILTGVKVISHNANPFPEGSFVIVSNHQGYFDVPALISVLPVSPAFIAKKELKKTPLLNIWMVAIECLFINRSDSPGSRKKIMDRLKEEGRNPLLLFPEGTRSQSSKLLPFRTGGLKMVFDSGTDVLPVRITGTYRIWEEKSRIRPGEVHIEILPVIKTADYMNGRFGDFLNEIRKTLSGHD